MVMPASHYCRLPLSALFLAQFSLVEHTEQYVPKVAAKSNPTNLQAFISNSS